MKDGNNNISTRDEMDMDDKRPKIIKFAFPTFGNILWTITFFWVLLNGRKMMNADGDLGFHITLGRRIIDQGAIPMQDIFSHTLTGESIIEHEWMAGVIFAAAESAFGFNGIILLCALVIATAFWLIYKWCRSNHQSLIFSILVTFLAVFSSIVHWLARPHVFTFLILVVWTMILDRLRQGKTKAWWTLPIIMLLWVNLHGVFLVGFATWFFFGLGVGWDEIFYKKLQENNLPPHFWHSYLLGGGTAFITSLINPYGFRLYRMIVTHVGNDFLTDNTIEFMSPDFHNWAFWPALIFIALLIVSLGLSNRRKSAGYLFNAGAWLAFGLYSARNLPLFAMVSVPLLVSSLDDLINDTAVQPKLFNLLKKTNTRLEIIDNGLKGYLLPVLSIIITVAGLAAGLRFDFSGEGYGFDPEVFPEGAVNWLETNPQDGEMLNDFKWGGYLQYRLWPEKKVFIDSKSHFYGEDFVRDYLKIINTEEGWQSLLDQYNVFWAILPPDVPVVDALQSELGWEPIYKDDTSVIIRK